MSPASAPPVRSASITSRSAPSRRVFPPPGVRAPVRGEPDATGLTGAFTASMAPESRRGSEAPWSPASTLAGPSSAVIRASIASMPSSSRRMSAAWGPPASAGTDSSRPVASRASMASMPSSSCSGPPPMRPPVTASGDSGPDAASKPAPASSGNREPAEDARRLVAERRAKPTPTHTSSTPAARPPITCRCSVVTRRRSASSDSRTVVKGLVRSDRVLDVIPLNSSWDRARRSSSTLAWAA